MLLLVRDYWQLLGRRRLRQAEEAEHCERGASHLGENDMLWKLHAARPLWLDTLFASEVRQVPLLTFDSNPCSRSLAGAATTAMPTKMVA
jgi:hypothetical protein